MSLFKLSFTNNERNDEDNVLCMTFTMPISRVEAKSIFPSVLAEEICDQIRKNGIQSDFHRDLSRFRDAISMICDEFEPKPKAPPKPKKVERIGKPADLETPEVIQLSDATIDFVMEEAVA